jgi:hypothetical protein
MKFRFGLILIALVISATSINGFRKTSVQASDESNAIVKTASAANQQVSSSSPALQGTHSSSESLHFEPLLLLLLGATLFFLSIAIRLVLSRTRRSKPMEANTNKPYAALMETRRGGA